MKRPFLIKRKREIIFEVQPLPFKKEDQEENPRKEITSIVMMSKRIDEFESEIRDKMVSEMRVFSCKIHSQKFLWSLLPSQNPERKC